MKYYILFLFIIIFICKGYSQHKEDAIWMLAYDNFWHNDSNYVTVGNTSFDFNHNPVKVEWASTCKIDFHETSASISDKNGNLQFYTNGITIANIDHDTMENGNGLNPGWDTDNSGGSGARNMQGAIILPFPEHKGEYYVLHTSYEQNYSPPRKLLYTFVDMNENGGKGKVVEKNIPFLQDTVGACCITACRHANGRDWWIMMPEVNSNCFYRILLSPIGLEVLGKSCVGDSNHFEAWQAYFSPDGTKFARHELNRIQLFDFDRCNGTFSNPRYISIPHNSVYWWLGGLSFAPNSKYLYFSSELFLYQLDTDAADVAASMQLAATYDSITVQVPAGSGPFLPVPFWFMALAPNGKIYIVPPNAAPVMHVIDQPDLPAPFCNVIQRGQPLPTINGYTMPNFPHFRLGAEVGSACDSLLSNQLSESSYQFVRVYPNPAEDVLTLEIPSLREVASCKIYNALGQEVYQQPISQSRTQIFVGNWGKGMYFYEVSTNKHKEYGKFFIE